MLNGRWLTFICLSLSLLLSSCGDLFTKEEKKSEKFNQFATCNLDMESISKITTQEIETDLKCLESNLYLFIEIVKSDRPGYLDQKSLEIYLNKNNGGVSESTLNILGAMFDLSSLIFGDDPGYIAKENVEKLSSLLIESNRMIVNGNVFSYFSDDSKITYAEHNRRKSVIYNSLVKVGKLVSKAVKVDGNNNEIDFLALIKKFKNSENAQHIAYAEDVLFLKKAILGGEAKKLNSKQLKRSMDVLGDIAKVLYDVSNLPDAIADENEIEEIVTILKEGTQTVINNLVIKDPNEVIVTYDGIKKVINNFAPELMRFYRYKSSVLKVKEILVSNSNEEFTISELKVILEDFVLENLSKGAFTYRSYSSNKDAISNIYKIYRDVKNLIVYEGEENYVDDFNRILLGYRFFQGNSFSPKFGFNYQRNAKGLFDIFIYEDIVTRFFEYYGTADKSVVKGYYLTMPQLQNFMTDFSELFEGEGFLLPGRSKGTAETITVMTSLFHAQSNGDNKIEVPEFVEFIVTLQTALKYSKSSQKFLKEVCDVDDFGRIHPKCFRDNFQNYLVSLTDDGKEVGEYLPLLMEYFEELGQQRYIDEYLVATTLFSRACSRFDDGTEVPMKSGDFLVTWAGLLVIEQSMLKFDSDSSRILEVHEVDEAYYTYESAVKGLIPSKRFKDSDILAKAIFKYLVKYNRAPELPKVTGGITLLRWIKQAGQFGWFTVRGLAWGGHSYQAANADRMTFASVLKVIAQNSPANKENPYDCSFLKDPK